LKIKGIHILFVLLCAVFSVTPLLTVYAGILLLFVFKVGWRENETKNLCINLFLYWAVVAILIPYADIIGKPLDQLYVFGKSDLTTASWVGLTALLFYLLGIQYSTQSIRSIDREVLVHLFSQYSSRKIIIAYLVISVLGILVQKVILFVPGGQVFLTVIYFKWVLLTFLIAHAVAVSSNKFLVVFIVCIEVLLSFSGFWAAFKDYIIVSIAAILFIYPRFSLRSYLFFILVFIFGILFSVIWTYSKGEYRKYLTGGERSQVVIQQDQLKNLQKFLEIVQHDFSASNFKYSFSIGVDNLIHRVSYVEFLALSIKHVPAQRPHEEGRLLKNAFDHVFQPRFLFPDKKVIYDSELTSSYTGVQFSGAEQGVSFSLGTVAESYVDFGRYFMFIPILFFGFWIGWLYRYFIVNGYNVIWGMCYAAPIFQFAWSFPVPTSKFLGWSFTYFVGFWVLNKFLIKYVDRFLLKN
jgi:hypothetical protein